MDTATQASISTGKPLQLIPWSEKIKDDNDWFHRNCNHFINLSRFYGSQGERSRDLSTFYNVYNNKFPMSWFTHITDPLSAKNPAHKVFPAKVRPVNILRTNLDLLMAEYPRRPFIYQVNNLSDASYSQYQEQLKGKLQGNLTEHFQTMLTQQMMEQGLLTENGEPVSEEAAKQVQEQLENLQLPEDVKESFFSSYKDNIAIQGQKWLRRAIQEHSIKPKLLKGFKHWLITGEVYSYKTVEFDNLVYRMISPKDIDYDKAVSMDFIEDAEWVVSRELLTLSDIVDRYYPALEKKDLDSLERRGYYSSPTAFYDILKDEETKFGKIAVYHVTWKGKKPIKYITNTQTGEEYEVDEDYPVDKETEKVTRTEWVNEIYEDTRIGAGIYVNPRPALFQRNAMNNFSSCKQPYNGRRFSDLHSENIGPLEIGLPFQIMYIIVTRTLELTIAKSKGKIILIDQNAIPKQEGWDEEKTFYYAEALGYMLLNRNQIGVDKSFNQFQVLDMTLFDSIQQLIQLQQHFKQEWDDALGINRQRKGQTYASDAVGNNERATFQSTVITDMIFNLYEEFVEKELQGLLDLSKFTNIDGVHKLWNDTELGNQLLEIDPDQYTCAELGIQVQSSAEAMQIKNKLEANVSAMLQNGSKPSTILEVLQSQNIAELSAKLKKIEDAQAQAEQAMAQNEQEAQKLADERNKDFMQYQEMLKTDYMNKEYDRKETIELIKLEGQAALTPEVEQKEDTINPLDVQKLQLEKDKHVSSIQQQNLDRVERMKKDVEDRKIKREEMENKIKVVKARPKPSTKK